MTKMPPESFMLRRNQCKLHDFFQPYETSSVITIDFCTNKNKDPRSESQTLLIILV
jgi:hypothetical protein